MPELKPVLKLEPGRPGDKLILASPADIKKTLTGAKVRVGFSTETAIYNWVRSQSAKRRVTDTVIWQEALATKLSTAWWAAHFEGMDPSAYFRARHKQGGRTRTTADIPRYLLDEIEACREELVEAFGSLGPRTLGMLLEAKILKWALDQAQQED